MQWPGVVPLWGLPVLQNRGKKQQVQLPLCKILRRFLKAKDSFVERHGEF